MLFCGYIVFQITTGTVLNVGLTLVVSSSVMCEQPVRRVNVDES